MSNLSEIINKQASELTDVEALLVSEYLFAYLAEDDDSISPTCHRKKSVTLINGEKIVHVKRLQIGVFKGEPYGYINEIVFSEVNDLWEIELKGMNWKKDRRVRIDIVKSIRDNDLKMVFLSELAKRALPSKTGELPSLD